ncbi:MAG: outer membrane protein assembly factor BamD [Oligoflexia bacterium]|nr:outer membrane protein assembly factor BamD [Oligoflexia bacterium]
MHRLLFVLIACLLLFSCSSIENIQGKDKAETYFLRGEAYLKEGMYEDALKKFNIVKNKFPYSKYAVDAELKIADTYYEKEDYIEASKFYSLFSELHPGERRRDYALYRSGMSFFNLLPSSVDRDYTYSYKALSSFKAVLELYPKSSFLKESLEKYTYIRKKLAEKEIYIGNFYRKKDKYLAASNRYLKVLKEFSGLGYEEKMYYELARCYSELEDREKAEYYVDTLIREYPDGEFAGKAKKLKEAL